MYSNLKKYGLSDRFVKEAALYDDLFLARVCEQHRDLYKVMGEQGMITAAISGKLDYSAADQLDYPAVGDFVMIDRESDALGNAVIHKVLKRSSLFLRQAAGGANERQVIASNIDTVFICMSLNEDFNLRRVERYLAIAWDSCATPVIVLTKADLCEDLKSMMDEISSVAIGVSVVVCSAEKGETDALEPYLEEGQTIAFIGSSGVGKSTLINSLAREDVLATGAIRDGDGKGRHTTTHRQLLLLPNGSIVIDTPGMREIQVSSGNLSKAFEDVESIMDGCRFKDCSHKSEPGCAIRAAIESGELSLERYESYLKLQREISYSGLNSRQTENEKINRMFGSKGEMKQFFKGIKKKR